MDTTSPAVVHILETLSQGGRLTRHLDLLTLLNESSTPQLWYTRLRDHGVEIPNYKLEARMMTPAEFSNAYMHLGGRLDIDHVKLERTGDVIVYTFPVLNLRGGTPMKFTLNLSTGWVESDSDHETWDVYSELAWIKAFGTL